MTNHPNRKRDEENEPTIEEMVAEAVEPLAAELREKLTPAHGNGVSPGLRANAAKVLGQAIAETLAQSLPQLLAEALRGQYYCGTCFVDRLNWETAHEADLKRAVEQMQIAAQAFPPGDPRLAQLNPFMFLPPHLLPSQDPADPHPDAVTDPAAGVVMIGGTLYCARHAPGVNRPGDAPKRPFFIAHASLSPGMIAEVTGQRPAA